MKLRFHTKLSYGIGGVADNAMYTLVGTFLLFFLTSVAGIRPAAAGTIVALGSVWEAMCGPVTGFLSDNTCSRFGKRKPFLMAAAFPVAIVTSLLFTAIDASYTVKIIYYTAMTLLFWQAFALFFVPYMAWGSDLTEDYHERTVLRSYAYLFNQVGMALGMVLPTVMVDWLMNMGRSVETSWSMLGIVVGVLSGGALLICALTIRKSDVKNFVKDPNRGKVLTARKIAYMFREYYEILKLRPIRFIIGASLLYLVANTFFSSDRVYYFTYNLGLSAGQISLIMLVITVVGIALTPVVTFICGLSDKKDVFMIGVGATGVLLIGARFIGVDSFAACCALCFIYSIGNTCYWQLMPSMIYDVCEAEELASGEKHSGQVISLQALSESASTAVGSLILGIILQTAGFNENVHAQSDMALSWVSNCFTLLPGICMILVAVVIANHPINKHSFQRIMDALERRAKGIEVDLKEFEDVFGKKFVKHNKKH
ncbi:MAG: MFS transporter [Clostridiales bacterium]|nr:MFS transporter [Clostridiales bacterium]